ncbi:MAG: Do family serine endopeptidase [Cohaesibacteraceae bacterium]
MFPARTRYADAMVVNRSLGQPLSWLAVLAAALVLVAGMTPAKAQSLRAEEPVPIADLAEELIDAVVNISTSERVSSRRAIPLPNLPDGSPFEDFFNDFFYEDGGSEGPSRESSLGSGFIIDPDGIIVTNNHVVEVGDAINVVMTDGRTFPAEIIGRDEATDLAVLQIQADEPLPFVNLAGSEDLRIGDWVLAIGNPFGLGGSVSLGIVSAMNRNIGAGPYDAFIQTAAAINRGNSGGPLFDLSGRVVGVNTAILSPTGRSVGVGFAIPASTVATVVDQLLTFGETRPGMLGVNIQEITPEMVEGLLLERHRGALVSAVTEDGPAALAGIERGDVIVQFNGRAIDVYSDLPARVAQTSPGTEVPVVIMRRGEEVDLMVVLSMRDGPVIEEPEREAVALLGMELATVGEAITFGFDLAEDAPGVAVVVVFTDGPAASKDSEPGSLILEVGQQGGDEPQQVADRVAALREEGRSQILMLIQDQDGQSRFVAISAD